MKSILLALDDTPAGSAARNVMRTTRPKQRSMIITHT